MYPTTNQQRQMQCVRHTQHAMPCKAPELRLRPLQDLPDVVTVQVPDPKDLEQSVRILTRCGWPFIVNGDKLTYSEVVHG